MEFKQNSSNLGEVELSNVNNYLGEKFNLTNHAIYLWDLGPLYEASVEETLNSPTTSVDTHKVAVTITSKFHWVDLLARGAQTILLRPFYIPAPVGTRTIVLDGMEVKDSDSWF